MIEGVLAVVLAVRVLWRCGCLVVVLWPAVDEQAVQHVVQRVVLC